MTDPRLERPLWRGRTNVDAYTIAWIEHAEAIKREKWPNRAELHHPFEITQGSYQGDAGDPDSGDTHALGGPVDARWCGHVECLLALRLAGGFVWWRKELWRDGRRVWPDHFHGGPIGHPHMDPSAERQETAYVNRRNGLSNNGPDDGPRLDPIPRPVWPWPEEDIVNEADIKAIATETTKQLLGTNVAADGPTVKAALRMASKAAGLEDRVAGRVAQLLITEPGGGATVTQDEIEAAVKQALREGTGD